MRTVAEIRAEISAERARHLRASRTLNIELAEAHAWVKEHKPDRPDRNLRIISHMEGTTGKVGHRIQTISLELGIGYSTVCNVWYDYVRAQKVARERQIKDYVNRERDTVPA